MGVRMVVARELKGLSFQRPVNGGLSWDGFPYGFLGSHIPDVFTY